MGLRDELNAVADDVRALAGSADIDERPTTVTIRTRTWSGGRVRNGTSTDVDVVLTPTPKVRQITQREIYGAGGLYRDGDIRIGPITPAYTASSGSGGYTVAQLAPVITTDGVELLYILAGQMTGEHKLVNLDNGKAHAWFLVVRLDRRTP